MIPERLARVYYPRMGDPFPLAVIVSFRAEKLDMISYMCDSPIGHAEHPKVILAVLPRKEFDLKYVPSKDDTEIKALAAVYAEHAKTLGIVPKALEFLKTLTSVKGLDMLDTQFGGQEAFNFPPPKKPKKEKVNPLIREAVAVAKAKAEREKTAAARAPVAKAVAEPVKAKAPLVKAKAEPVKAKAPLVKAKAEPVKAKPVKAKDGRSILGAPIKDVHIKGKPLPDRLNSNSAAGFIRTLIREDKWTDDEIVAKALKKFPNSAIKQATVSWNRHYMKTKLNEQPPARRT